MSLEEKPPVDGRRTLAVGGRTASRGPIVALAARIGRLSFERESGGTVVAVAQFSSVDHSDGKSAAMLTIRTSDVKLAEQLTLEGDYTILLYRRLLDA